MLVLSRRVNEKIKIGDNIYITVCSVGEGRVRLGITAPREVPVLREEIARLPTVDTTEQDDAS